MKHSHVWNLGKPRRVSGSGGKRWQFAIDTPYRCACGASRVERRRSRLAWEALELRDARTVSR